MKLARAHTARARILAALAVLLLALPAGALGHAQYFCQMMGRLVDSCCCNSESDLAHAPPQNATPEIKAQDCCQRLERARHQAAPALRDGALRLVSPLVAIAPPFTRVIAAPELRAIAIPSRARAPPLASRPPIFIQNCSLLT